MVAKHAVGWWRPQAWSRNLPISEWLHTQQDMLAKVSINYPSGAMESKPRKGRKKNIDVIVSGQTVKNGIFPVNEITWPELARRYILVLKSMDDNLDYLDISSHEYEKVFHCLNGNGGPLCGNLRGMAAIKADAVAIAEASKKIFSSVKSKIVDVVIDLKDLDIDESAIETKRIDDKPDWIDRLEPIQNLATNVGAKIRNRIRDSLNKGPPDWAAEMLRESISKDVYKGNAAGPTKRIVREVLNKAKSENHVTKKEVKESFVVKKVSDVIIKRCRMVLRSVTAQDENKIVFGLMAESLLKPDEFSRLLDFRTIDLRLDAGFYGGSHESFIEDVHEVWYKVSRWCKVPPLFMFTIKDLFDLHKTTGLEKKKRKVFQGIVFITCWCLWKARNDKRFSNGAISGEKIFQDVKSLGFLWLKNRSKGCTISWRDWYNFDWL